MIKLYTLAEAKELFAQTLFNTTSKVTKISKHSVISGIISGAARLFQKVMKELSIVDMYLDIDAAYENYLDNIANQWGISSRFAATGSSTFVRLYATAGTTYIAGIHNFTGSHGLIFQLEQNVTISDLGFTYAKVNCTAVGKLTNVEPLTLTQITSALSGHISVINEYYAQFGSDVENDELFRNRIKDTGNIAAQKTISYLTQVFQKINSNILKVYNQGFNTIGQLTIAVATQDGSALSNIELDNLRQLSLEYFSLSELSVWGQANQNLQIINVEFTPIDVSFRVELQDSYDIDTFRKNAQIKLSKYLDYRSWDESVQVLDRGILLGTISSVAGVKYIPDAFFYPKVDVPLDRLKLPRIRSFLMYGMTGNLLTADTAILNPYYYPNTQDSAYKATFTV